MAKNTPEFPPTSDGVYHSSCHLPLGEKLFAVEQFHFVRIGKYLLGIGKKNINCFWEFQDRKINAHSLEASEAYRKINF